MQSSIVLKDFIKQIRVPGGYNRADLFCVYTQFHWLIELFESILSKIFVYLVKLP